VLSVKESGNVASETERKWDGMVMEEEEVYWKASERRRGGTDGSCRLSASKGQQQLDC